MDLFLRYSSSLFSAFLGISAVAGALFGNRFYFARLGSRKEGPPMPAWLARPFLLVAGMAFLYAAFDLWRGA